MTEQEPADERLHVAGEGSVAVPEPPAGCENVTVSPVAGLRVPVTVAAHVEGDPTLTGLVQDTVVIVDALLTVRAKVPELATLLVSPE